MFGQTPPYPPVDAEVAGPLEATRRSGPVHVYAENLAELRAFTSGLDTPPGWENLDVTCGGAIEARDVIIPGPDRTKLMLMVLTPAVRTDAALPVIYHLHGGGMVMGNRAIGVQTYLEHVARGSAVLVSPEYRLAPEHPDPAPADDCYAGLVWAARNAHEYGGDPSRIIVAGGSAGGGLAAGVVLQARDRGFPSITHQILLYPMLDDRIESVSSTMLDRECVWDRHDNLFGWSSLLGSRRGGENVSYYAAPARATELGGLPRTYMDVGSTDTLRDEAIDYAKRLSEFGVVVDFHLWGGGVHGFELHAPNAAISRACEAVRDDFIRRALGGSGRF